MTGNQKNHTLSFTRPVARRDALSCLGALAFGVACAAEKEGTPEATGGSPGTTGGRPGSGGGPSTGGMNTATGGVPTLGTGGASSPVGGSAPGTGGSAPTSQGGSGGTAAGGSPSGGSTTGGASGGTTDAGGSGGRITGGTSPGGQAQAGMPGGAGSGGQSSMGVPDFGPAPTCTLSPTDAQGEGPFFVHDDEVMDDIPLGRTDIREGHEGVEFQLHIRVLNEGMMCNSPISGVEVYIWHTNALGMYSGFNGQDPNKNYMGSLERTVENDERFCRGMQVTNASGIVSFRTLYPGWYFGRPLHTHFLILKPGSGADTMSYRGSQYHVFTTQFYFDETFSRNIHENFQPYSTRASGSAYEQYVKADSRNPIRPSLKLDGNIVIGTLNMITNSAMSRK